MNGVQSMSVFEVSYPGAKRAEIEGPLVLQPLVTLQYFQPRLAFSVWGLVSGNPMMVMMAVSMGLMFFLPKMMSGLDPEEMKKLQKDMGASGGGGLEGFLSKLTAQ